MAAAAGLATAPTLNASNRDSTNKLFPMPEICAMFVLSMLLAALTPDPE
jgi:hypothetical protein